jgi:AcrR family transcriptional regulator
MKQAMNDTATRVIHAAIQLFSHKGYSGSSTREIARLASVNEALLFHYFPTKQDLFLAALRSCLERLRIRKELHAGLAQNGEPEEVLPLIVELLVQTAIYQPELVRLFSVGFLELGPGTETLYREHLAPTFQAIGAYLKSCVQNDTVRGLDPDITLRAIATSILCRPLYGQRMGEAFSNADEAIACYSQFWLNALMPWRDSNVSAKKPHLAFTPAGSRASEAAPGETRDVDS